LGVAEDEWPSSAWLRGCDRDGLIVLEALTVMLSSVQFFIMERRRRGWRICKADGPFLGGLTGLFGGGLTGIGTSTHLYALTVVFLQVQFCLVELGRGLTSAVH
jgi:hypothetical protein